MTDHMSYNPVRPDPISVAAYIARSYRVRNGLHGEELLKIYQASSEIAQKILAGSRNISLQAAMDKVEIARTGSAFAKYIPRPRHNSPIARKKEEFTVGLRVIFRDSNEGLIASDVNKSCSKTEIAFSPKIEDENIDTSVYICVSSKDLKKAPLSEKGAIAAK